ncbi:hypothetical protein AGMMS49942_14360 [Spirochaetia bacterium]|nr:hypothetical protein AGMMS49942_14360 [Spirochaetia bacterium]
MQIETILLENIDDPDSLFVFPTDIAVNHWADRLLVLRGGGSLAMEQFTAWDTFKRESIRARKQDKKSVPAVLRKIFVSRLVRENAENCKAGKPPLFSTLIPAEYAYTGASFVRWFTGILPQLGSWFEKTTGTAAESITDIEETIRAGLDPDDRDLYTLTVRYKQFLDEHMLFEPAWETPPFTDTGKQCFIFFPESLTDFSEYRELLEGAPHVTIVRLTESGASDTPPQTYFYTNSRSEIAEAALYIRALHEHKGAAFEDIVVSIPDAENYEPYVSREFGIRNIPFVSREGKPLAGYAGGKLFGAIAQCNNRNFSFDSVTNLLLNSHLPWRDPDSISQLIDFGIRNNCIVSWREDGKELDVWEDALAAPAGGREERVRNFYHALKRDIKKICAAGSFAAIRQYYFAFREKFFKADRDACPPETDLVLSRCISELLTLIGIEKAYPDITVPDFYGFFTEYLEDVQYLPQQSSSGVTVLPYRTAAPVPFEYHIVIGASQDNLSAVFGSLPFLLAEKRRKLGIEDIDASEAFIKLHTLNSRKRVVFFCAEETFSGYAIPHSFLNVTTPPVKRYGETDRENFSDDPFIAEQELYRDIQAGKQVPGSPHRLYQQQIEGFAAWRGRRNAADVPEHGPDPLVMELIKARYCSSKAFPGKLSVSASAMKPYYQCALQWLFKEILQLEKVRMETTLMADNVAGSLYHAALDFFFKRVKAEAGGALLSLENGQLPSIYKTFIAEGVEAALEQFSSGNKQFEISALTARLLRAERQGIQDQLVIFLTALLEYFAGYVVADSELKLNYEPAGKQFFLTGMVDCVLEDRRSSPTGVIIDFKLGNAPARKLCTGEGERGLEDFQLPMYLNLAEQNGYEKVHTALFFSILKAEPTVLFGVINTPKKGSEKPYRQNDRIERTGEADGKFAMLMAGFKEKTERYAADVLSGTFRTISDDDETCFACEYHGVCRTVYTIDRMAHNG